MDYKEFVYDSIGNKHERKNLYLLDLARAGKEEKKKLISGKNDHPYIIKLKAFKEKEKDFLKHINDEAAKNFRGSGSKNIVSLKKKFYLADQKAEFYKDYIDLSYDAELAYKTSLHETIHIPEIIANDEELKAKLEDRKDSLSRLNEIDRQTAEAEIRKQSAERQKLYELELVDLKDKLYQGLISKKAYKTEVNIRKRALSEDLKAISFIDKRKSLEDDIRNIEHHLKIDIPEKLNVLESDIADVKRKVPEEIEKTKPINAYLTFLLPGLGQLLNKQYVKAILFFLSSLFIYLIAIPYALGYGNYRGTGISGLISLAEGGKRLDKSMIFMIEGILALILLVIAAFAIYISFRDVLKVEKDQIKGIRVRNWFDTKQNIESDGFPYLVSSPALIVIIFIVLIPVFTSLLISFTNMDPDHQNKFQWIGLDNYKLIFTGTGIAGKSFWLILFWTVIWTFGATTLAIAIGFVLSLLANQERIKGKGFFRTVYILPWAVPAFITIMFFSLMFARNGIITELIENIFGLSLDVKNNTLQTRAILILLQGWLGSSYIFLLSTGILQGIPKDLYEAAEIDGATGIQQTLKITVPLVLFQAGPLLINQYTFNFNNFSIIYLFNNGGPFNPHLYGNLAGSSDILISYIYKLTISNSYQAIGGAITLMISMALMIFAYIGFRNTQAFKEK